MREEHDKESFGKSCFDLRQDLPEPELAMQEFHGVLKENGVLIIQLPNTSSIGASWEKEEWFGYRDKTYDYYLMKILGDR